MFRSWVSCLFFFLFLGSLSAQDKTKTDSLLALLAHKTLVDTVRLEVLSDLGFYHPNSLEGLNYAQQAFALAKKLNDQVNQAAILEIIGTQHRLLGNKTAAFQALFDALSSYEQLNRPQEVGAIYIQLGENYIVDERYPQAIQSLQKGLAIHTQLKDTFKLVIANINLGEAYRLANKLDSATTCFHTALHLNQLLQDEQIQGYALGNLGMVSNSLGELDKAIPELQEAITILSKLGDPYSVAIYKADLGQIYLKKQELKQGEQQLLTAFQLVKQEQLKEPIRDISKMLADFYENQKQYADGMYYQKIYQVYQDSLVNRENIQQVEQIKTGYEINKRETEISHLEDQKQKQEQLTYGLITGLSIVVLLALGLIWSYNRIVEKKRLIEQREQEKVLLLKELNHRVKNNLQVVSSLLSLQSREFKGHPAKEALTAGKLRVEALSLIHQKLYQEDHQTQVPIREYIKELVQNLQAAYAEDTTLNFQIQNIQLDIDLAIPLALIINELVINAFKYAFEGIKQPSLEIQMEKKGDNLSLMVEDNGIGFTSPDLKTSTSFGLKLVRSLVKQLDGKIHMTGEQGSCWQITVKAKNRFTH